MLLANSQRFLILIRLHFNDVSTNNAVHKTNYYSIVDEDVSFETKKRTRICVIYGVCEFKKIFGFRRLGNFWFKQMDACN